MHGRDAAREIAELDLREARGGDQLRERNLRRKAPDAFRKVPVGGTVARYGFTQTRQDRERIGLVQLVEPGSSHARKFETEEAAAGLEHAVGFGERLLEMRRVADTKGDRIGIAAVALDRQVLRI